MSAGENAGASAEATPVPDAQPTSTAEIVQTGNNNTNADNDTEISLPAAAPIVPDDALFFEDFSNNDNGWSLAAKNNGSARIAQQRLVLSAKKDDCIIVTIPSFTVEDQYYIQSDIKVESPWDIIGYAFGNPPNQFYKYGAGDINSGSGWRVQSYSPTGDILSVTEYDEKLWQDNETFTLGMEVTSGLYTLYLNGEMLESAQFSPQGNNIGLFVCNTLHESQVGFDNITIRESR